MRPKNSFYWKFSVIVDKNFPMGLNPYTAIRAYALRGKVSDKSKKIFELSLTV